MPISSKLVIDETAEGLAIFDSNEGGVVVSITNSMYYGGTSSKQVGMLGGEVTSGMPKESVVSSISVTSGMYGVFLHRSR